MVAARPPIYFGAASKAVFGGKGGEAMREEARRRKEEEEMATESQEAADGDREEPDEFLWCCPRCWAKSWGSVEEMLEAHGFVDDAVYAPFDDSMW